MPVTNIPKTPLAFMWFVSKPHKWLMFTVVFIVIVASALSQGSSYFFKLIVDAAEVGDIDQVILFGLAYPIATLFIELMFRLSGFIGARYTSDTLKTTADVLVAYTLKHSHTYFADRFAGSILTKFGNVHGGIGSLIPNFLWTILTAVVSYIVTFVLVATVDVLSAVLFLVLTLTLIYFNRWLAPRKRELSRAHAERRSELMGRSADVFTNISASRQYARLQNESKELQDLTTKRREAFRISWWYSERMRLYNGLILFAFAFLMFVSLVLKLQSGDISTGEFVLVLSLISQITGSLVFIGQSFNDMAETFGEMEEGLEDLIVPYEIVDATDATALRVTEPTLKWDAVTFKYGEKTVFDNFSIDIKAGERTGLVGPSGAGKTTFVSLLLRQHDLDSGQILIDGQDISRVTQDSLREQIAVVPQEPLLFHRSIRENIAYGKPDATDDEIIEVARKAQAHDFVCELEQGYDTLVGERGVKLSGGQKQRIAIARAMLKDAPILVLDEATSALDSESEVAIQTALQELMEGKTVVAIAHRLSTLREMDRIIVLEAGQIVEDGTHHELAKAGGTYERLWAHQAGGFLQE